MERKDADVVVIALSLDNIMYPSPIDDPLFAAHKLLDFRDSQNFSYYASDNPAGMIGCAMQVGFTSSICICTLFETKSDDSTNFVSLTKAKNRHAHHQAAFPSISPKKTCQRQARPSWQHSISLLH